MGYATTMMKKTGRAMRLDTQIIEVRPLLLRKEQVRLRLRETCARNHKSKKPKSLDTADVVRDVETSRFHSLTRILANQRRKLVRTPSMRRPVGVKGIRFGICWSRYFFPAESPLSPPFHPHSSLSALLRSVQVGCSRFSRCCHLIVDLGSISKMKAGPGD